MNRIVCQFSCGAASAVATKLILAEYEGKAEVAIINAFVKEEHPDNRRFLADCEKWFGRQVTVLRDEKYGASVIQVFKRRQYMKGIRGAPCSAELKRKLLDAWKKPGDVMVFGYTACIGCVKGGEAYHLGVAAPVGGEPDMTVRILQGDCLSVLRTMPSESVHCVVTSPPYWGLRDYGTANWEGGDPACTHQQFSADAVAAMHLNSSSLQGDSAQRNAADARLAYKEKCGHCGAVRIDRQIGLEPTPSEFVRRLVEAFREVRRVLRSDGTCWVNLGDTYASAWVCNRRSQVGSGSLENGKRADRPNRLVEGLKEKDLIGIPWRVAFALQDDGWYLRNDIIWSKKNCMPESVRDRCTKSHEYIFLLAKSEDYFYDSVAIEEEQEEHERTRRLREQSQGLDTTFTLRRDQPHGQDAPGKTGVAKSARARQDLARKGTRNKRTVWSVATTPFTDAHFATFPPKLIEPCILAGTSAHGHCDKCGAGWVRVMGDKSETGERGAGNTERKPASARGVPVDTGGKSSGAVAGNVPWKPTTRETASWKPTCKCEGGGVIPGVVLDPFGGAGTTALVSDRHGRDAILIELNPEYATMAENRVRADGPLFAEVTA